MTDSKDIVVVPLFVADGWHVEETIPADLRKEQLEKYYTGSLRYSKAVGTHEKIEDIILDLVRTFPLP